MASQENYQNLTDEELVALTLKDQESFIYLIERYERKLLNYIRKITNVDEDEAKDILQDSFIKVYSNLNDFDLDLKFSSWIYRIVRNQVISNYRKKSARPQTISFEVENNILENIASDLDIEKEVELIQLREKIFEALNRLDRKYKEVIVLKFFEEKEYHEISDIIKKPMGTVATLINRAKKKLKEELYEQ